MVRTICRVHQGEQFLPPAVAETLASRKPDAGFSAREREVLALLARGKSNKKIAAALNVAEITVKCLLSMIFLRLGVSDSTQAIMAAAQRGLVHL